VTAVPEYREWRPAAALIRSVACSWAGRLADDGTPFTESVLPDACIDLVWDGRRLVVAGPDTGPVPITREPGGIFAGLRFRPGLAPTVLGLPAAALLDQRVDAADVLGPGVAAVVDRLAGAPSLREAASVLEQAVVDRLGEAAPADRLVEGLVSTLQARPAWAPPVTVAVLADRLGAGERQLHRRCRAAVGYGPKVLDRVLRFRRFLHLVEAPAGPARGLADLAAAAGYADQPHLTRECVRLAGTTPARLLAVRSVQDRAAVPPVSLEA
jgi:AraC-like DNA-binding protein